MASKVKTSYTIKWEKQFIWLQRSKVPDCAFCKLCQKSFRIDGAGVGQVKSHHKSKTHQDRENLSNGSTDQRTFIISANKTINLSSGSFVLTPEESIVKAEVLQALNHAQCNYSFASARGDSERFREMFPDSEIAKNYQQGETKVKYNLQYGIAPFVKQSLINDFSDTPFSFKFDETTTLKIQKQYDGYVQYWSKRSDCVVNSYCGSLFVGHCTNVHLLEHFEHFGEDMGWNPSFLLHLGMDGPRVNLAFQERLSKSLEDKSDTTFLDIGTCPLHNVHNGFAKGLQVLDFNVDQFVVDINSFFKLSSARREDYSHLEEITELPPHFSIKHSSTRWVTLKKVTIRMLEQWRNLTEYFLIFLPKQSNFKGKNGLKANMRYQRIKEALESELTQPCLAFVAFAAQDFESFLIEFQSNEPLIHMLYPKMGNLLLKLMTKFISKANVYDDADGMRTPKPVSDLTKVDVSLKSVQLSTKNIDIGTKAKLLLLESNLSVAEKSTFRHNCLKFYAVAVSYLQDKLPFNVSLIKHAQYFHPDKRNDANSTGAISNLSLKVARCTKNVLHKVFLLDPHETAEDLCDKVRAQWKEYQCESIPSEYYEKTAPDSIPESQNESYWQAAFEAFGITYPIKCSKMKRVDEYWRSVGKMRNDLGHFKYPQLYALAKCILSISHGNTVPERGFSINKYLLSAHGSSTSNDAIVALRLIKDHLIEIGGYMNFPITKNLIASVATARQKYHQDLEAKRKLVEKETLRIKNLKEANENKKDLQGKIMEIDAEIKVRESGITVAEESVHEGNQKLQQQLKQANKLSRGELQKAQSMIDMGLDRKRTLDMELADLRSKKAKLLEKK